MNDSQKYIIRVQLIADIVVIAVTYFLAWLLRFRTSIFGVPVRTLSLDYYLRALLFIVPLFLVLYLAMHLYADFRSMRRRNEAVGIAIANTIGLLIVIVGLFVVKQIHFSRGMLVIFYFMNMILDFAVRLALRSSFEKLMKKGYGSRNLILVGYSRSAEELIDRIIRFPEWGYRIVGILDDNAEPGTEYRKVKVIGKIKDLSGYLKENKVEEVDITLPLDQYSRLEKIVAKCEKSGVHTKFRPDYYNIISTRPFTEDLWGLPAINIRYVPLSNSFNAIVKRIGDIIGSALLIALFSPVMLVAVIGVKLSSPGPLIFRQIRVGLHNKEFEMYKFRSMRVQSEKEEKKAWTVKNDSRVTKFGKIIRKTSIDELPQFFNVLKGDMSLVGPRPERPYFVEKFKEEIPRYMVKHQVRPGITGWAQVNGLRGDTSIQKRIEYDLYYIENWSVSFDLRILFLTVFKGFVNKNAY